MASFAYDTKVHKYMGQTPFGLFRGRPAVIPTTMVFSTPGRHEGGESVEKPGDFEQIQGTPGVRAGDAEDGGRDPLYSMG